MPATPVRSALKPTSSLLPRVLDGLQALDSDHARYIDEGIRASFADSLEIDQNLKHGRESENRWDYLIGHQDSGCVVGLEPHSAKQDEVTTVIAKRKNALEQLRDHLKPGVKIKEWFWVASGRNHFPNTDKVRFRLEQNGIKFVCPKLLAKDLMKLSESAPATAKSKRKQPQ
jgi:hypothetical protein